MDQLPLTIFAAIAITRNLKAQEDSYDITKIVLHIIRTICVLASSILCSPLGIVYHSINSVVCQDRRFLMFVLKDLIIGVAALGTLLLAFKCFTIFSSSLSLLEKLSSVSHPLFGIGVLIIPSLLLQHPKINEGMQNGSLVISC
jgi:hypothetical protein